MSKADWAGLLVSGVVGYFNPKIGMALVALTALLALLGII